MHTKDPIKNPALRMRLDFLFGTGAVRRMKPAAGGYLCRNYDVRTENGRYFLKQYRKRTSAWVHEIKFAEKFFAEGGVPIILPHKDRFGRRAFWFEGNWYSIFPFVAGVSPDGDALEPVTLASIGSMLGRLHRIGARERLRPFQPFAHWDYDRFHLEYVELELVLRDRRDDHPFLSRVREIARLKYDLVQRHRAENPEAILPFDHLLHGDFIYQNTFVDGRGEIAWVYDLERTCVGPRAFELARSLMINCFENGWAREQEERAAHLLRAYRETYPIGYDEFLKGVRMYFMDLIHSNSMEAKFLLYGIDRHLKIYEAHAQRVEQFARMDLDAFCQGLYQAS